MKLTVEEAIMMIKWYNVVQENNVLNKNDEDIYNFLLNFVENANEINLNEQ